MPQFMRWLWEFSGVRTLCAPGTERMCVAALLRAPGSTNLAQEYTSEDERMHDPLHAGAGLDVLVQHCSLHERAMRISDSRFIRMMNICVAMRSSVLCICLIREKVWPLQVTVLAS
jgi:hypothetical protein